MYHFLVLQGILGQWYTLKSDRFVFCENLGDTPLFCGNLFIVFLVCVCVCKIWVLIWI